MAFAVAAHIVAVVFVVHTVVAVFLVFVAHGVDAVAHSVFRLPSALPHLLHPGDFGNHGDWSFQVHKDIEN